MPQLSVAWSQDSKFGQVLWVRVTRHFLAHVYGRFSLSISSTAFEKLAGFMCLRERSLAPPSLIGSCRVIGLNLEGGWELAGDPVGKKMWKI